MRKDTVNKEKKEKNNGFHTSPLISLRFERRNTKPPASKVTILSGTEIREFIFSLLSSSRK